MSSNIADHLLISVNVVAVKIRGEKYYEYPTFAPNPALRPIYLIKRLFTATAPYISENYKDYLPFTRTAF